MKAIPFAPLSTRAVVAFFCSDPVSTEQGRTKCKPAEDGAWTGSVGAVRGYAEEETPLASGAW